MFFKKIAFLSLLLSSLTLASDLLDDQLGLARESDNPSHDRSYLTPVDTSKNIVVRLPPKATYFHQLATARDHEIMVKLNFRVSKIVENTDNAFYVDDKPTDQLFNRVIMTAWDSIQNILDVSESSFDLEFTSEDRVIALCDISGVPHLQNTPFFTLGAGEMFMPAPVSDNLRSEYRCAEGASYPETSTIISSNPDVEPPAITNDGVIAATLE